MEDCIVHSTRGDATNPLLTLQEFLSFSSQYETIFHNGATAEQPHPSSSTSPPPPPPPFSISPLPSATLKHQRGPLGLLITPQLEMLAPFQGQLRLGLAVGAFQPQHHLLGRLGLLVEDGLRLAAVAGLFAIVAALPLRDRGCLWGTHGGWLLVAVCWLR